MAKEKMNNNAKELLRLVYEYDKALKENIDCSDAVLSRIKNLCSDIQGLELIK